MLVIPSWDSQHPLKFINMMILQATSQNGHHDEITNTVEAEKSLSETGKAH